MDVWKEMELKMVRYPWMIGLGWAGLVELALM